MRFAVRLSSVVVLVALSGCGGGGGGSSSPGIVPGFSIGGLQVGSNYAGSRQVLGTPSEAEPSETEWTIVATWSGGIACSFDDTNQNEVLDSTESCYAVICVAPYSGATDKGIKIGSMRQEVWQAYGSPSGSENDPDFGLVETYSTGIGFVYDTLGRVKTIIVWTPTLGLRSSQPKHAGAR